MNNYVSCSNVMPMWRAKLFILTLLISSGLGTDNQYITIDFESEISYDFPIDISANNNRSIQFNFKTKLDNSFIFYLGYFHETKSKPSQFLSVFIENGIFFTVVSIPNAGTPTFYTKKIYCESLYKQCSDNKWHSVFMKHSKNEILMSLDEKTIQFQNFGQIKNSKFAEIIFSRSPEPFLIYRSTYFKSTKALNSFRGCLSKVYLEQNNVKINIVEMVAKNVYKFKTKGSIYPNKCVDLFPLVPVTLHSQSEYLQIQASKSFMYERVEISFRTLKENCLLAFNPSDRNFYFHNIEIRDSKIFFSVVYGTMIFGEFLSPLNVSNGDEHNLEFSFKRGLTAVSVDGAKHVFNFSSEDLDVNMKGQWYVGSMPKQYIFLLPPQIWSGWLREFFSGCLLSFKINDEPVQLDLLFDKNSSLKIGCHTLKEIDSLNLCANKRCNDGTCRYDWDEYVCDCQSTNFTQPSCNRPSTVAEFNGYQFMKISLKNHYRSEVEDISLRFKTILPDGIILSSDSEISGTTDKFQIFLKSGNVYLLLNFGHGNKKFKTNENCFDGKWHTVKVSRRKNNVKMSIDERIYYFNFQSHSDAITKDYIQIGKVTGSKNDVFVGYMMHLVFNGVEYFELAKNEAPANIEITASLIPTNYIMQFPVYFQSVTSYLLLSKVNIFGDFRLDFLLKTNQASGLVLLLKGDSGDYLFLEMVDRLLHVVYNWGSGYKRKASENGPLDDNQWHSVKIVRHQSKMHSFAFRVDGFPEGDRADVPVERGGLNFNHYGRMYLGGHRKNESLVMFDNETPRSKNGFRGCIASFYVNNSLSSEEPVKYRDLLQEATEVNGVHENCPVHSADVVTYCTSDYCGFGGRCVQQWRGLICDCSMTSFVGLKCQDVSTTVQFLKQPAYIIYKFPTPRNHTIDNLAFGFQTNTVKEASLISIMGTSKQNEFLNMRIKILEGRGFVEMSYNLEGNMYSFLESRTNVVDGLYHIVRFTRRGIMATLQVDNLSRRIYVPDVQDGMNHFSQHSLVIVGSRLLGNRNSFQGYISGLNFNNIPLTDIITSHIEPNTQLINKSNIIPVPSFVPRFSDRSSLSLRQSEQEVKSPKDNPSVNRLVIAKLNCPGITEEERSQCQVPNPKGLVKPGIIYRKLDKNLNEEEPFSPEPITLPAPSQPITSEYGGQLLVTDVNIYPTIHKKTNSPSVNINLWLIVAFSSAGAFLLVALSCLIYRCSTKDEGSYSVEEDRVCIQAREKSQKLNLQILNDDKLNEGLLTNPSKKTAKKKRRCGDTKEWYV